MTSLPRTVDELLAILLPDEWLREDADLIAVSRAHEDALLNGTHFLRSEEVEDWEIIEAREKGNFDLPRVRFFVERLDAPTIMSLLANPAHLNHFTAMAVMLASAIRMKSA